MDWLNESSNIDTYANCGVNVCVNKTSSGACVAHLCVGSKFCLMNYSS